MRDIGSVILFGILIPILGLMLVAGGAPQVLAQEEPMQAISDDQFWALVDRSAAHDADPKRQMAALAAGLDKLSPEEILAFELAFYRQMTRAYDLDLWGAAYVVNGGVADDGFEYFRRWLISRGRTIFEETLADPDSLADRLPRDAEGPAEFEEFSYVAMDVWSRKTGRSLDDFGALTVDAMAAMTDAEPSGEPFEEDEDALAARYPRLWARFGENPLG